MISSSYMQYFALSGFVQPPHHDKADSLAHDGFTLIELLTVIAIIGILATVLLVFVNPVDLLARSRDAGRDAGMEQLRTALVDYLGINNAGPTANNSWISTLVVADAGGLKATPSAISYVEGAACTTNNQNNYCYNASGSNAIIYVRLESNVQAQKCASGNPYFVYDTSTNNSCLVCGITEPQVGASCNAKQ